MLGICGHWIERFSASFIWARLEGLGLLGEGVEAGHDDAFGICTDAEVFAANGSWWLTGVALEASWWPDASYQTWQHEGEARVLDAC